MGSEMSLREMCDNGVLFLTDGYRTRRDQLAADGAPILRVAHVREGFIEVDKTDRISRDFAPRFAQKTSRVDDVVITTKGTVGRAACIPERFAGYVYSPQVCVLRVLDREVLDPAWLYCWVRSPEFQDQLDLYSGQTDMAPYVKLKDLLGFGMPVPPIEEQRAISEVLGAIDDRIEWCDAGTALVHDMVRSLAEQHETDGTVRLAEMADIRRSTISASKLQGGWWTHYSIPAFDDGQQAPVEPGADIRSGKFSVPQNAVLVSKLNPTWPRVWLPAVDDDPPAICSTELMPLVPHDASEESAAALWAALLTPGFNRQLRERVQGSTGSHQRVRPEDMLACRVMNPATLAKETGELLVTLAARVRELRVQRRSLVSSRDALLPRLLSGELRIEDPTRVLGAVA